VDSSTGLDSEVTYRGVVYPWDCDHMGHMNVMRYVGKFDEATWILFARLGLTRQYLAEAGRGMAAVEQQIAYRREVMAGDVLAVRSELVEVRDKALRFRHVMVRDDDQSVVAETTLTAVHIDTGLRKAAAFAPEIRARADRWTESRTGPSGPA
jgi:acyl-CoA thioester hydrolase